MTSDKTPWNDLEDFNAGWNIILNDLGKFVTIINMLSSLDFVDYNDYILGCYNYSQTFNSQKNNNDNFKLFSF